MRETRRALLAVSLQTLLSIAGYVVAKGALHQIPAPALLLVRSVPAALLLLLVVALRGPGGAPVRRADLLPLTGLGILAVPCNQAFFYWGLHLSSAAHAALLYALTPALVLAIGVIRGTERLTPPRTGGIVLAFVGVVIVLYGNLVAPRQAVSGSGGVFGALAQAPSPQPLLGDLLILAAVNSWALYTALSRGVVERLGSVKATAGALTVGTLVYLPFGVALSRSTDLAGVSWQAWACAVWLILFASVASYLLWYYALKRLEPSRVAIFANVQPIGTALLAYLQLHQRVQGSFLLGSGLVIGGVLLAQRRGVGLDLVDPAAAGGDLQQSG